MAKGFIVSRSSRDSGSSSTDDIVLQLDDTILVNDGFVLRDGIVVHDDGLLDDVGLVGLRDIAEDVGDGLSRGRIGRPGLAQLSRWLLLELNVVWLVLGMRILGHVFSSSPRARPDRRGHARAPAMDSGYTRACMVSLLATPRGLRCLAE